MKSISIKQDSINFKNKMLSIGEERELFIKYREYNDNDAKNKILTFNTPLVIYTSMVYSIAIFLRIL